MTIKSLDHFSQVLNALEAVEPVLTKMHIYIQEGHCELPFGDIAPVLDKVRRAIKHATI